MVKVTTKEAYARVLYELLSEKVLTDYNRLIEDSPIMDMFADPIKYERCSYVDFSFIDHNGNKTGSFPVLN